MLSIKTSLGSIFSLTLILCLLFACGNTKNTTKNKTKSTSKLITDKSIHADETFSAIANNTARLRAMLSGQYAQYNLTGEDEDGNEVYTPWVVNGGKDSMMLYSIPVGEPAKVGYWLYHYQVMTSLPDEPIYTAFEKFIEIDRDTTRSVYYDTPEDFNVPLSVLLEKTSGSFGSVDLSSLSLSKDGEEVLYVRQDPLFFRGYTPMMNNPQEKGKFKRDFYHIRPVGIVYTSFTYETADADKSAGGSRSKFVKLGMLREHK